MERNPVIEYERGLSRRWAGYTYYDTPDGEDLVKKLIFTGKIGFVGGLMLGLSSAYSDYPIPTNNIERLSRILKNVVPAVGVVSAFTITTYFATVIRGKDDQINYILGSFASGSIVGATIGSRWIGFYTSLVFSAIGYTKKTFEMNNKKVMQNLRKKTTFPSYYQRKFDFSVMPDNIRGNWTRTLPKEE